MSKHDSFIKFLEKYFLDPDCVVYSAVDRYNFGMLTEDIFHDSKPYAELPQDKVSAFAHSYIPGFLRSEVYSYENSGMATGAALAAAVMEFKRTGKSEAQERAKRLFRGLKVIEDCGRDFYDGFVTKYYGRRFTYQTSNDQCLYHIYGLDAYYEIASPEERRYIEKQIPAIVRFWVERNYTYSYFDLTDMVWPPLRFPALLAIAWHYSKEDIFKSEFERIVRENIDCVPENNCIARYRNRRFSDYEEEHNIRYLHSMADCCTMDVMNHLLILKVFPDHEFVPVWKAGIRMMWDQSKSVLLPDGRCLTLGFYQVDTGKTVEPYEDSNRAWAKTAWSTMIIRAGLQGLEYMSECRDEVIGHAENVLDKLNPETMTYYEEMRNFSKEQNWRSRLLSGDSIANYLWAYELLQIEKNRNGL
jgi:hypothetical protein